MKKNIKRLLWASLSFLGMSCILGSCASNEEHIEESYENKENTENSSGTPYSLLNLTDPQWETLLGINSFGENYVREAYTSSPNKDSSNFFIARFEVARMLAILANGADEVTQKEISELLGADIEKLNSLFGVATDWLKRADNQVRFNSGTSLWLANNTPVDNDFVTILKNVYDAEAYSRELSSAATKEEINRWYADKTEGMIPEFLETTLPTLVNMYVGNAVFFNGKWTTPFEKSDTSRESFHSSDGSEGIVEMMHLKEISLSYAELKEGGEVIEMPFGNGIYSIWFYLPPAGMKIDNALSFLECIDQPDIYVAKKINLSLPKFNIRNRSENVKNILLNMGFENLFDSSAFSRLGQLELASLTQESVIEFDESGAKAAAASGGIWAAHGIVHDLEDVIEMNFDRPFYFCIKANPNFVLFSGIVNKL
ncbi:MAG: serpin family protein [Muribaculaceae bacterium]|nr:serpin family protein [Muribaculaceae bacterium]